MDINEINKRIKALTTRSKAFVAEVQEVGLACLMQVEEHGNTTPLNDLVGALSRSQVQAFVEWALAYGKVKRNSQDKMKAGVYFAYDKGRTTDIEAAKAKVWDEFAPERDESAKRAFDLQAATLALLKKAAAAGSSQSIINAIAAAAGLDAAKVPKGAPVDAPVALV
jgi:hypothetical protein